MSELSDPPKVDLSKSTEITLEAVRAFGEESAETQLEVLTELRNLAGDETNGVVTAFVASMVAVLIAIFAPQVVALPNEPLGQILISIAFVVGIMLGIFPLYRSLVVEAKPRRIAATRLAAYEDEITRRRSESGGRGRRWRRAH